MNPCSKSTVVGCPFFVCFSSIFVFINKINWFLLWTFSFLNNFGALAKKLHVWSTGDSAHEKVDSASDTDPNYWHRSSTLLKGVCHEIFDLQFFLWFETIWALINRLKYVRIRFRFCRDIRILKKLLGVHPTVESDSAVCIIPRSQTLWCASYRGVKLRIANHTAESVTCQVSVLSRNFTIVISLWCLKILLWK